MRRGYTRDAASVKTRLRLSIPIDPPAEAVIDPSLLQLELLLGGKMLLRVWGCGIQGFGLLEVRGSGAWPLALRRQLDCCKNLQATALEDIGGIQELQCNLGPSSTKQAT